MPDMRLKRINAKSLAAGSKDGPFEIFYKGIFMGLVDIIPGISGGTIAFIVGIYDRLISAIKSINFRFVPYLFPAISNRKYYEKARRTFFSIDFSFLLPLATGILLAFMAAIRVILFAIENYPAFIYSFFFGLIFASAGVIYGRVGKAGPKALSSGFVGFLFASLLVGFGKLALSHGFPIIFTTGFLAVCAMILPGVSGSFIVLLMGQYKYMLNALRAIQVYWTEIAVFLAGALLSLFSFSRLLSFLLRRYRPHTLLFLTGLMIGALRLPLEKTVAALNVSGEPLTLVGAIISGTIGIFLVVLIELQRKKR